MSDFQLDPEEQNAACASAPEVIIINGIPLSIRKITERDCFALYNEAKREATKAFNPIREVVDALRGFDCPEEYRRELLQTAARLKCQRAIGDEDLTAWLLSAPGVAFRAWLLCDRSISLEVLRGIITEENALDTFMEIDRASGSELVRKAFGGGAANPLLATTGLSNTAAASGQSSTGEC